MRSADTPVMDAKDEDALSEEARDDLERHRDDEDDELEDDEPLLDVSSALLLGAALVGGAMLIGWFTGPPAAAAEPTTPSPTPTISVPSR